MFSCRLQDEIHGADCHLSTDSTGRAFREKCNLHTNDIIREYLLSFCIGSFKSKIFSHVCEVLQFFVILLSGENSSDHAGASLSCMRINTFLHKHLNMNRLTLQYGIRIKINLHKSTSETDAVITCKLKAIRHFKMICQFVDHKCS